MRATCESCALPQPRDWRAGDLCIHCGLAVRQESRCFWCAKWTPLGKFCRKCGADVLEDPSLYGAARMLKDAGADRFAIPKMLREFDPERIETFRAMYQSQAAIVAAHVADLEYVETFLHQRVWSAELEDQLIAQLPWPEGQGLKVIGYHDEDRLRQIATLAPAGITATLAAIAIHSHGDFSLKDRVLLGLQDKDHRIQEEAALALTHWNALLESGFPREHAVLIEYLLLQSSFKQQASVRLTSLNAKKYPPDADALGSPDEDVRFAAALNSCHLDTLREVAQNPHAPQSKRYAATLHLTRANQIDAQVARSIGDLEHHQIVDELNALIRQKQPFPLLRDELLSLMRKNTSAAIRSRAATVLSRSVSMEAAIEMFAIDPKNAETVRILFQSGMPPEAFAVIGTELIREDLFRASMYGMDAAAKAGRMPDDFVSACYSSANDKMREELILFAERQLADRECVPLRDFLIRQCFIEKGVARREAWGTMSRLCHRDGYQSVCPFRLETKAAERIFGSMDSFLSLFIAFFRDPDWRKDNVICHRANRFLYDASDEVWASIAESASAHELVSTIVERIDTDTFCFLEAALIGLAAASPRMRPGIEESLRRIALNYRFHALAEYALQRIEQLTGRPADTQ